MSPPANSKGKPEFIAGEDTRAPRGWHHRGYLPHFDDQSQIQTITYRLADSLPQEILQRLSTELDNAEGDTAYRQRIETYLDSGYGGCCLKQPVIAQIVINSWLKFHTIRYDLFEWVVMPNHVHILLVPHEGFAIAEIVKGFKSCTARQINKIIGNNGQLWQEDYWDRYIRNSRHFNAAAAYIRENPVKAGLADKPESWPWSSAGTPPLGARVSSPAVSTQPIPTNTTSLPILGARVSSPASNLAYPFNVAGEDTRAPSIGEKR